MTVRERIRERLDKGMDCQRLEVIDESDQHNVPRGSETHFRVVIVSADFAGKPLIVRHRMVYGLLNEEMAGPVHALALHTYTAEEWRYRLGQAPLSPPCQGGGRS